MVKTMSNDKINYGSSISDTDSYMKKVSTHSVRTVDDLLRYVVDGSSYDADDVIAIVVGVDGFDGSLLESKLQSVYMSPKGIESADDVDEISDVYDKLMGLVDSPRSVKVLEPSDIDTVFYQISVSPDADVPTPERKYINVETLGDDKNWVIAFYLRYKE